MRICVTASKRRKKCESKGLVLQKRFSQPCCYSASLVSSSLILALSCVISAADFLAAVSLSRRCSITFIEESPDCCLTLNIFLSLSATRSLSSWISVSLSSICFLSCMFSFPMSLARLSPTELIADNIEYHGQIAPLI